MAESDSEKPSRRDVLKRLGKGAGLAFGGAVVGTGLAAEFQTIEQHPTHIYRHGETIKTAAGNVLVNGWRLLIRTSDFEKYNKEHPQKGLEFALDSGLGPRSPLTPTLTANKDDVRIYNPGWEDVVTFRGQKYWMMTGVPSADQPFALFQERTKDGGRAYPIKFDFITYRPDDRKEQPPRFYSEVPLEKTTLQEISKLIQMFDNYGTYHYPVYIFNSPSETIASVAPDQPIKISSHAFTKEVYHNQGMQNLTHELGHTVLYAAKSASKYTLLSTLEQAYNQWMQAAGYNTPGFRLNIPQDQLDSNPIIGVFDESSYTNSPSLDMGHPWDILDEFFASAVTVLKYFPDQFTEKYKALDPKAQPAVAAAAKSVLDFLKQNKQAGLPTDEQLIPEKEKILAAIA